MTVGLLVAVLVLAASGACRPAPAGEVVVSAAASLTDVVVDLERRFEQAHPELDLVVNLGGSSTLRAQIEDGAPVDVLLSADRSNVEALVREGHVDGEPTRFARNSLQLAVPAGNPGGVSSLADLADASLAVGLCEAHVPCGDLAGRVLAAAGVEPDVDTREPDVRSLLGRLAAGELDAALVYVTDVRAAEGAVEGVGPPSTGDLSTPYVGARIAGAPNPRGAAAVVSFLASPDARLVLATHGFDPR